MTRVSIAKTENDFYAAFNRAIDDIGGHLITPGDHVLIKPNLVEPAATGQRTDNQSQGYRSSGLLLS
jgi:uncharacterized protein (DUF362 family)